MKKIFSYAFFLLILLSIHKNLWADTPVVSANGFSCVKSQSLVTCQGQFPGVSGTFSASGTFGVQMTYESQGMNRNRYIYDSTSGCLMQIALNAVGVVTQAYVKNSLGSTQSFILPAQQMQAFQFCKS